MNKTVLVKNVQTIAVQDEKYAKISLKDTTIFVDAVFEAVKDALVKGEKVAITGFGSFDVAERPARIGRNPATGEEIEIAATKTVKFKAGSALKDAVKGA